MTGTKESGVVTYLSTLTWVKDWTFDNNKRKEN